MVLDESALKVLPTNIRAVSHLIVSSGHPGVYPGLSYVQA